MSPSVTFYHGRIVAERVLVTIRTGGGSDGLDVVFFLNAHDLERLLHDGALALVSMQEERVRAAEHARLEAEDAPGEDEEA